MVERAIKAFVAVMAFASVGLYGQTDEEPPATRTDVRAAVSEMRKAVRDAEKRAADNGARLSSVTISETEKRFSAVKGEIAKANEENRRALDAERLRASWFQRLAASAVALSLVMGAVTLVAVILRRRPEKAGSGQQSYAVPPAPGSFVNPDVPAIKEFAAAHGLRTVPFTLKLEREGAEFACYAELRDGKPPLVRFVSDMDHPVNWDNRKQKAARLMAARQEITAANA